jgi:hypothetical protein
MLYKKLLLLFTLITVYLCPLYAASTDSCYDLTDTSLMMHMDGVDGAHVFTDETGKTVTVHGGVVYTETDYPKFGSAAVNGFADHQYLIVADGDAWDFGSGDFTIEFWWRWHGSTASWGEIPFWYSNVARTEYWIIIADPMLNSQLVHLQFYFKTGGTQYLYPVFQGNISGTIGVWSHFAITRSGNTFRMFQDGILIDTETESHAMPAISADLTIGQYDTDLGYPPKDRIDEVRITKGVAIWTGNFTPPSAPYSECGGGGVGRRRITITSGD